MMFKMNHKNVILSNIHYHKQHSDYPMVYKSCYFSLLLFTAGLPVNPGSHDTMHNHTTLYTKPKEQRQINRMAFV